MKTPFQTIEGEILFWKDVLKHDPEDQQAKSRIEELTQLLAPNPKLTSYERKQIQNQCKANKNIYPLAESILKRYKQITTEKAEDTYVYEGGIYVDATKTILEETEQTLKEDATTHKAQEILGHIARTTIRYNTQIYAQQPWLLCVKNGILNVYDNQFMSHTPTIIFFNKIPVEYTPHLTCPKIEAFLKQIMNMEDITKVQEYIGYCLYKGMPYHKALMLVGTGSNGKSTLIKLIQKFLGSENCASISLQSLETNRFSSILLRDKLVNLFADLPSEAMKQTSQFKILISGDPIQGERKFKHAVLFNNTCKMIYSANQVPISYDDSDAFYRRWEIVIFPNTFTEATTNPQILEEIATPEELSGMLNWVVQGLKNLLERGQFTGTKQVNELRELYLRMSDSVASFQLDKIEASPEEHVFKAELYGTYVTYCRVKRYPALSENSFHRRFQKLMNVEYCTPRNEEGKQKAAWKGIRLSKEGKEKDMVDMEDIDVFGNFKQSRVDSNKVRENPNNLNIVNIFPEYSSFEPPFNEPHGLIEGIPTKCVLCGLKRCYYQHKITGQLYCQSCAESVERGWEVAK